MPLICRNVKKLSRNYPPLYSKTGIKKLVFEMMKKRYDSDDVANPHNSSISQVTLLYPK